jgi:hypothetical protein
MAIYNLTYMNNATSILDLVNGIGTSLPSGGEFLIGNLILFSFFVIFLVLTMRHNFNEMLIVNSFITTILAILFYGAEMIKVSTIVYPIVLMILALIIYLFNNQ